MSNIVEKYFNSKPVQSYFRTIKRFLPDEQRSTAAIGLDIGTGECKLIELSRSKAGFELVNCILEPIQNGDTKGSIQTILSQLSAPPTSLYTSVFGKGTLIRYIEMPRMSLEDLRNSFGIEADKYFPFAQDQIYTDCYILDEKGKGKTMSVMAAAAKREIIDKRIKLLTDMDIPVELIGLNPIVLANTLHVLGFEEGQEKAASKDKPEQTVALFDMGESVSSLTILVDNLPRFTRDIFIGGKDFTKAISNAMGIDFKEAEELKRNPDQKAEEVIDACESAIMNMIQELRLSMDYFATEMNKEIETLLLTGGTSMLKGVVEVFEKNLEIGVRQWNPLTNIILSEDLAETIDQYSCKLGVALGLALYQYD